MQRLMQAVTKRSPAEHLAGFVRVEEDELAEQAQAAEGEEEKKSSSASAAAPSSSSAASSRRFVHPRALSLMSCSQSEESGRYFVVLPLSEAQTLRRAVHTAHPLFRAGRASDTGVQFALWALDGHLIETTPGYVPARMPHVQSDCPDASAGVKLPAAAADELSSYQVLTSLQTARFLNGELYYSPAEISSLLRGLGSIHLWHRRQLLEQLLLARHRDHRTVAKTPLEQALLLDDEAHWMLQQSLRVALRSACDRRGLSLLQAFHWLDVEGKGLLAVDELWTACHALGVTSAESSLVRPSDIVDLLRAADVDGDGKLDFAEFARALAISHTHAQEDEQHGLQQSQQAKETFVQTTDSSSKSAATPAPPLPKLTLLKMPAPDPSAPTPSFVPPVAATGIVPVTAAPAAAPAVARVPAAAAPAAAVVASPPALPVVGTAQWSCSVCTYLNSPSRTRCEMCDTPKQ